VARARHLEQRRQRVRPRARVRRRLHTSPQRSSSSARPASSPTSWPAVVVLGHHEQQRTDATTERFSRPNASCWLRDGWR
jgi:hypothetical protein